VSKVQVLAEVRERRSFCEGVESSGKRRFWMESRTSRIRSRGSAPLGES
jgi:hypothetical protein